MEKNDGGPAFPSVLEATTFLGMSLRDWFAGQTLMNLAANWHRYDDNTNTNNVAMRCYELADAMLKEREK